MRTRSHIYLQEDDTLVSDLFSANAEEKLVCCPNLQFTEISTFHTSYCAVEDRRKVIEPRLDVHEFMPLITAVVAGKSASIIVGGTASDLVRDSMNALRYVSVDDQPIGEASLPSVDFPPDCFEWLLSAWGACFADAQA